MRRGLVLLSVLVMAASLTVTGGVSAQSGGTIPTPLVPKACEPDPATNYYPPAGCQRITYLYGPLYITPGDNLILFGPVTIEKPRQDGYMLRFRPDMIAHRPTTEDPSRWTAPAIEELHLHHAVWLSQGRSDHRSPLAAVGEEKTTLELPNNPSVGYSGARVYGSDNWLLNYMIHNQSLVSENVFVVYEIDFLPDAPAKALGDTFTPVTPVWLNVAGFNGANPVYNTERGRGSTFEWNGEQIKACGFPSQNCADFDPYGDDKNHAGNNGKEPTIPGWITGQTNKADGRSALREGTIFWMGGHLHPGGTWIDVDLWRDTNTEEGETPVVDPGETQRVFTSDAKYFDPNGPVSWDMVMEVTKPDYRLKIKEGDRFIVNSYYETEKASWYEGMGIVVIFLAVGDESGPDAFEDPGDFVGPDHNLTTHGPLDEALNHCGDRTRDAAVCADADGDPLEIGRKVKTNHISIEGFSYVPGNLGSQSVVIPSVPKGEPLTWVNADVPAAIFHTVTACKYPCNGPLGVSYPLANGANDKGDVHQFDSLQLGYGPWGVTAAANRADYTLETENLDAGVYTYFCRVHPGMRGAFEVTES